MDVSAGSSGVRRLEAGRFAVSDVTFAAGTYLARHAHPAACVAVVLGGRVRKTYARATHEAARGTVIAMPSEEPHVDRFGAEGARIVVVESQDGVDATAAFADWGAAAVAHRIAGELAEPDAFTPLAVEGLALELLAAARRAPGDGGRWVDGAAEILRERFRDPPTAAELAATVGVHPAHLARGFRARFGDSIGGYVRGLRLDWAAARLVRGDVALARLACEAGFADQSHFTRAFTRRFGVPPGRYRRAHR